ncbi:hypothetical protein RAZWK3B_15428 [Roseobacter sp. AzwK-3b]|uniref:hypothetical protein n=1 Tax=Roseobacter sp. AzwK-3b TaxID=351016 RepID=UPI000156A3BF|nr:hypothetical protein [Roseobacter sp. AzwK-3b]EDM70801.1 hypothetical protein RAZWK3B_15428 [Roseobacter sp. AzwK-3b]
MFQAVVRAIFRKKVTLAPEPEPAQDTSISVDEIELRVTEFLARGPATTTQISGHMNRSSSHMASYLTNMHRKGGLIKAAAFKSSDQKRASATLWALSVEYLVPRETVECGDD